MSKVCAAVVAVFAAVLSMSRVNLADAARKPVYSVRQVLRVGFGFFSPSVPEEFFPLTCSEARLMKPADG